MFLRIERSKIGLLFKYYLRNEPFTNNLGEVKFYSLNKYLLSSYYVPGTVLDIVYTTVNNTVSVPKEHINWRGFL